MGNGAAAAGDPRIRPGVNFGPDQGEITEVVNIPHHEPMTLTQAKNKLTSIRWSLIRNHDYSGGRLTIKGNTLYVVDIPFSGGMEPLLEIRSKEDDGYHIVYPDGLTEYNSLAA